jgi:hypothetical protein
MDRTMRRSALIRFVPDIDRVILTLRGQRAILDADLAAIYGVTTRRLNEQVKRNRDRFPPDFAYQLTASEKTEVVANCDHLARLKFTPGLPWAFTEHGAIMAANVLKSALAAQMSVLVVRAFVRLRAALAGNEELARKLAAVEAELKSRLDVHEAAIVEVLQRIMQILAPPPEPLPPKPAIGFHVKEDAVAYRVRAKGGEQTTARGNRTLRPTRKSGSREAQFHRT